MRKTIVALTLLMVALPACRRNQHKQQNYADTFAAPPPPGAEEKWVVKEPEEPPPPAEPPAPPVPTSPPPTVDLGFAFGEPKETTQRACTKNGAWSKKAGVYSCSKSQDAEGFAGKPVFNFCDDKLCAVGLVVVVEEPDWHAWKQRFDEMKQVLVTRHGPPTTESQNVTPDCENESFIHCMSEGSAKVEAIWKWKEGHRVSLVMSKKQSGTGPAAIRYASVVNAGP